MARIGGLRRKSRYKLKKPVKKRGKISIRNYFQEFKEGDRVHLKLEPAVHKGAFNPRFHGKSGIVRAKTGSCYSIEINDLKKQKTLIVHPVHLERM